MGFQRAGYRVLGGVELDQKATLTRATNFFKNAGPGAVRLHSETHDITKLTPAQFMVQVLRKSCPDDTVDVIIGGPPCQAFARIGRAKLREIMDHPQAFLKDERAKLYVNFLEYVEFFHPFAVVMENVPDIMNFGGQNVAEEIACSLESLGYRTRYTILNSAYYGVPQLRQRFFLIAIADSLDVEPTFPEPTHCTPLPGGYGSARRVALRTIGSSGHAGSRYISPPNAQLSLPAAVTAWEALSDLPSITSHLQGNLNLGSRDFKQCVAYRRDGELSSYASLMRGWPGFESKEGVCHHVTRLLPRDYEIFRRMRAGDQYPQAYKTALKMLDEVLDQVERDMGKRPSPESADYQGLSSEIVPPYDPAKFPNKWRKMEPDKPSRTLTAHLSKDTYSHIHYDSAQARVITVREAARLQSFPDGFVFTGPMNAAFRQIGNAVPPLQAYALAKHLRGLLHIGAECEHDSVSPVMDGDWREESGELGQASRDATPYVRTQGPSEQEDEAPSS